MPPRFSVIIPAYNAEKFIGSAIKSVLAQTSKEECEIIVIDDNSSDDTKPIVVAMSEQHQQIVYVANDRTKGPSGSRNSGLLKATGEYITFLDADDLWLPNHLQEGLEFFSKHINVDVVFFNCEIKDYKTNSHITDWFSARSFPKKLQLEKIGDDGFLIRSDMFNALLDESFVHLQSMVIKKAVLEDIFFNESIKRSEDRDFSVQIYMKSKANFSFKNVITGVYYRHENSLTSETVESSLSTVLDHINIFSGYLSNFSLDESTALKLNNLIYKRYLTASYYYRTLNSYYLAISTLQKSFKHKKSLSQLKEFTKLIFSMLLYKIRTLPHQRSE